MIAGVGLDLVEVARVRSLLLRKGNRALERLFCDEERAYCDARAARERHYAARIAAKEAVFKALSGSDDARTIGWREIEVRVDGHGRPDIVLSGQAAKRAAALHVSRVLVTLTHSDTTAAAVVILEVLG
jgi:holo-[acyl-carrier protein] synthase